MNTELTDSILAQNEHLSLCDTTPNENGYPSGLKKAIYGFKTIDEAKEIAEELGGELGYIDKKDGWHVWHRKEDWYAQPFKLDCEDLGYHNETDDAEEFEEYAREEIKFFIEEEKTLDEINELMKDIMYVKEKIDSLLDGQTVFFGIDGNFGASEVVDKECMSYCYDTRTHAVAVLIDDTEDEE